jgi:hypothetical protein
MVQGEIGCEQFGAGTLGTGMVTPGMEILLDTLAVACWLAVAAVWAMARAFVIGVDVRNGWSGKACGWRGSTVGGSLLGTTGVGEASSLGMRFGVGAVFGEATLCGGAVTGRGPGSVVGRLVGGTQPSKPKGMVGRWPCRTSYWSSRISSLMRPSGTMGTLRGAADSGGGGSVMSGVLGGAAAGGRVPRSVTRSCRA